MAKGIGLDAGEYEIKIVELDGSFRRPRLAKVSIDRVSQPGLAVDAGHAAREAQVALHALKDAKVSRDNVILGFPCREAVLRTLDVPFKGVEQIRKVIKFEVEDSIHSHNVDDMIVDFHVIGETDTGTKVLVAAVPKQPLRLTLEALDALGIDPEVVDLDTMALHRVAEWAGCYGALPAEEGVERQVAAKPPAEIAPPPKVRIVVDVGGRSTRILAVLDGKLVDMRALRVGVDGIADDIAAARGIDLPAAREAVFKVFESGQAFSFVAAEAAGEDAPAPAEGAVVTALSAPLTPAEVSAAATELLRRIHRDLMRFVASMQGTGGVEALFITGGGAFLPGLDEVFQDVFGCTPRPLPVLANLNHNLDDDEAKWVEPRIAVAVGLALGAMGGVATLQFRQEDLAFQRRFDRVKFPLAIACMLAVFLLFIYGMRLHKRIDQRGKDYGDVYLVDKPVAQGRQKSITRAQLFGYVGNLINEKSKYSCDAQLGRAEYQNLVEKVVDADTFERLPVIEKFLRNHLNEQQQATGVYEDLQLPSGYQVVARLTGIVQSVENELGSFVVMNLKLNHGARDPFVEFEIAVRGPNYRARFERLLSAISADFKNPDTPFVDFGDASGTRGEEVFQGEVEGAINVVRIKLKEKA